MIPEKLKVGDEIRVIAPASSLSLVSKDVKELALKRLEDMGYSVTFGKYCKENDIFSSSSIESRVKDIHEAFKDKKVKAILTVLGGFNSNQLLKYIDYKLIRDNPKIICGFSDITALNNAIFQKTKMITYIGPHFSSFGMKKGLDYTREYFVKCLTSDNSYKVEPSKKWSDDAWFLNQNKREFINNKGPLVINAGSAEGVVFGGNLCTLNLLQGTEFMPGIKNSVLFIEDDDLVEDSFSMEFDRNLQSLIDQPIFKNVKALVIGRFQKKTDINFDKLKYIIKSKKELKDIPVIANLDFGHTTPMITFPIGGKVKITARGQKLSLDIIEH
ncbi:MAG: LD-carboxypeptidase [Candidatus Pacebacteria bacterium]|nr:LD-carboxypeptidase [Candidatus Paceibacterota bacterium]